MTPQLTWVQAGREGTSVEAVGSQEIGVRAVDQRVRQDAPAGGNAGGSRELPLPPISMHCARRSVQSPSSGHCVRPPPSGHV